MPIYNYKCSECSKDFEVLARHKDEGVECISCGSSNIKRVYSSFDFSLKKTPAASCQSGTCRGGTCGLQ
jgi:putative FmdB family regulatory protein